VQAFAKRIGALLLNVPLSAVHSKWFGESEKQIAAIFSLSKKLHAEGFTTVVFVDEVEGLLGELQGTAATIDSRPRSEFLQLWDGLEATRGTIVVAATNRPDRLNDAIWRRFSRQIEVCFATAFQAALAVAFSY
jgi:ATPase family AAA domain-containing protein 1